MAQTPRFKIYSAAGEYLACFKYLAHAAVLTASLGTGSTIRDGHGKNAVIWTEGTGQQSSVGRAQYVVHKAMERIDYLHSIEQDKLALQSRKVSGAL